MSIEEQSIDEAAAEQVPPGIRLQSRQRVYDQLRSTLRSPLWICLLVALLIRAWLTYHTHGVIDGDEAMVGIQAEHILRGEHPIYYYGQPYMGSLEAYLMALLFAIAGPSVWMLRAEPILLSLVVVWLTWKLAGALAEAAQLSPSARLLFKTLAALCAAVAPLYDTVLELRTLGGYIETFVLTLCLLLAVFQLTRRWQASAAKKELAWRWAVIGFIVGLGYWVNPLIISAVLAAALWIIGFCIIELVQLSGKRSTGGSASPLAFVQGLLLAVTGIPACIVGLAPALYWGAYNQWANFTFALQLGSVQTINIGLRAHYHGHLALIHDETIFYFKYVLPRLIGGALPDENSTMAAIHTFTFYLGLLCLIVTFMLVALSLVWHQPQLVRVRQLGALPLLFTLCAAFTFCTSTVTSAGLINFQHDIAGRYGTPLMLVLPYFFALVFTLASVSIYTWGKRRRAIIPENRAGQPARPIGLLHIPVVAQALLFALLFIYLGAQAYTYVLTDPDETYQSASCPIAPSYNDPIIAYLQQEHVHYAWAITWIGNPIIFKTNDGIILSDPRSILNHKNDLGRVPAYTEALLHADRPAMLTIVKHSDAHPLLLRILDQKHVTYAAKRFPSEPGYDVLVVTSLSRTVALSESKAFISAFPGCI